MVRRAQLVELDTSSSLPTPAPAGRARRHRRLIFVAAFGLLAVIGAVTLALAWPNGLAHCPDVVDGELKFINPSPVPGASNLSDGALWQYDRMNSVPGIGGRMTPFDLSVKIVDASGAVITGRSDVHTQLCTMVHEIYLWDPHTWRETLDKSPAFETSSVLASKSNQFWELIAQELAERILDAPNYTSPIDTFGPACVSANGALLVACRNRGLADAHAVTISTFIDGRRDPLNLVSRRITVTSIRGQWPLHMSSEVEYAIIFPSGKPQVSPYHERLDWRPIVDGKRLEANVVVTAINAPWAPDRFPDFARLAVPLRHLLLQGPVNDPRRPQTNESYSDVAALRHAFADLIARMREPPASEVVAHELVPFLVEKYYCAHIEPRAHSHDQRMTHAMSGHSPFHADPLRVAASLFFADGFARPPEGFASGVDEFAAYLLPAIGSGWKGAFTNISLSLLVSR